MGIGVSNAGTHIYACIIFAESYKESCNSESCIATIPIDFWNTETNCLVALENPQKEYYKTRNLPTVFLADNSREMFSRKVLQKDL